MQPSRGPQESDQSQSRLVEDERRSPRDPQPGNTCLHLNVAAQFYPNVLLPGDPGRAMAIATGRLAEPRMFNHRRGLWGYSGVSLGDPSLDGPSLDGPSLDGPSLDGTDAEGTGFVVQSTGMGGPSAAIICEELADLGAEIFLRVGTCGAIDPALKLGDLVVVQEAICEDGTSRALVVGERVQADRDLTESLVQTAAGMGHTTHTGVNASIDLFYDPDGEAHYRRLHDAGALTIEMESATVLGVGRRRDVRSACLLVVTDELWAGERRRLDPEGIEQAGEVLGLVGIAAVEALLR